MAQKKNEARAALQHFKDFKARCMDYFTKIGHPKDEMKQLWEAVLAVELTLTDKTSDTRKKITIDRAIEILGEETFLSGISRCAFHATATREDTEGKYSVYFNLSKWWKSN